MHVWLVCKMALNYLGIQEYPACLWLLRPFLR